MFLTREKAFSPIASIIAGLIWRISFARVESSYSEIIRSLMVPLQALANHRTTSSYGLSPALLIITISWAHACDMLPDISANIIRRAKRIRASIFWLVNTVLQIILKSNPLLSILHRQYCTSKTLSMVRYNFFFLYVESVENCLYLSLLRLCGERKIQPRRE